MPPPKVPAPPSPAVGGNPNPLSEAGLGSGPSCSQLDSAPSRQLASCRVKGGCPPPERAVPSARCLSGHLGPLLSLSPGSYVGQCLVTQFPHPSGGESRAPEGFHAAANSLRDGGSPNGPKAHFTQDASGGVLSNLLRSSRAQSCRPGAVVLLLSPLAPMLYPKTARPRGSLTKSRGVGEAGAALWGAQAGYQRSVKVHSWGSGALLTSTLGMEPGRQHQRSAQSSQVRAVGTARLCLPNLRARLAAGQLGRGAYKRGKASPGLYQRMHGPHLSPKRVSGSWEATSPVATPLFYIANGRGQPPRCLAASASRRHPGSSASFQAT